MCPGKTARLHRMIGNFAGRTSPKLRFLTLRFICTVYETLKRTEMTDEHLNSVDLQDPEYLNDKTK